MRRPIPLASPSLGSSLGMSSIVAPLERSFLGRDVVTALHTQTHRSACPSNDVTHVPGVKGHGGSAYAACGQHLSLELLRHSCGVLALRTVAIHVPWRARSFLNGRLPATLITSHTTHSSGSLMTLSAALLGHLLLRHASLGRSQHWDRILQSQHGDG
jgi:hypothetical protein